MSKARKKKASEVPVSKLRWNCPVSELDFETTADVEPSEEIIGQERALRAIRLGLDIESPGYNIFVAGFVGTGRNTTIKRLLEELDKGETPPDDLCYVNNFKDQESPILLRLKAGLGSQFKKNVHDFVETLKKEIPQIFESQEYISRKKEVMEEYDKKGKNFFKDLDKKVREEGFTIVDVQVGPIKRPEVLPLIDGNPTNMDQVEAMVEKGRFPKEEFEEMEKKQKKRRKVAVDLRATAEGCPCPEGPGHLSGSVAERGELGVIAAINARGYRGEMSPRPCRLFPFL